MFHRVFYDHWASIVPIIAFIFTFAAFIIGSLRALTTRKELINHIAQLPLDPAPPANPTPNQDKNP
ncbi:hypothetical protein FEM03_10890 [Phragmitibacter flavus]|uniref:Cbb3-type cytochrome c oxidase subunit 3 n=1 Tax=Phragmitibacter flavus TaxID=2576071 RepID=A0A5R8KEW4_9BACT|nr:hypothetical protein [Phragmitibacter flavus]TLD70807.1 hypothetical protein FEM03_10890 [Phragmitibacter flavus]